MARQTVGQKARRVLTFLMAVGKPRAVRHLARFGFTQAELDRGWSLLRALAGDKLGIGPAPAADPKHLEELDAWENLWFPILSAVLRPRFPTVHGWLFLNLSQQQGNDVVISVGTLVDRLAQLATPDTKVPPEVVADAPAALEILNERGFTADRVGEAKTLLEKLGQIGEVPAPDPEEEAERLARAETALWDWYLEWSTIAQQAISDGRVLRSLGFGAKASSASAGVEEEDAAEEEEEDETDEEEPGVRVA